MAKKITDKEILDWLDENWGTIWGCPSFEMNVYKTNLRKASMAEITRQRKGKK